MLQYQTWKYCRITKIFIFINTCDSWKHNFLMLSFNIIDFIAQINVLERLQKRVASNSHSFIDLVVIIWIEVIIDLMAKYREKKTYTTDMIVSMILLIV